MKKKLLSFIIVLMIMVNVPACVLAQSSLSGPMRIAIRKYRHGNYTGCLQDCMNIVYHHPSNSTAYYYMAISYVQAGKKDQAIKAYSKVLKLKSNARLAEYAATGKRCLETPDKCRLQSDSVATSSDLDKFIATPTSDGLSGPVRADFEQKHLESVKNKINSGRDFDSYDFRKFKDYSNQRSQADLDSVIAQAKPSSEEVAAALKVLKDAGVNTYDKAQVAVPAKAQAADSVVEPYPQTAAYQSPELAQLNMLMGGNGQQKDNNAMANMIPYMLAQNKNGTTNYSPQMMQAVIMNSMMTNFNFDVDNDKDK